MHLVIFTLRTRQEAITRTYSTWDDAAVHYGCAAGRGIAYMASVNRLIRYCRRAASLSDDVPHCDITSRYDMSPHRDVRPSVRQLTSLDAIRDVDTDHTADGTLALNAHALNAGLATVIMIDSSSLNHTLEMTRALNTHTHTHTHERVKRF